ncbi:MAG: hypothetical protein K8H75_16150 [Sulfuricella sp.]|nr:hypothetical protein [Sulfuricella sp.]
MHDHSDGQSRFNPSYPLLCICINLRIPALANGHNQNLDRFRIRSIDNPRAAGADAPVSADVGRFVKTPAGAIKTGSWA